MNQIPTEVGTNAGPFTGIDTDTDSFRTGCEFNRVKLKAMLSRSLDKYKLFSFLSNCVTYHALGATKDMRFPVGVVQNNVQGWVLGRVLLGC